MRMCGNGEEVEQDKAEVQDNDKMLWWPPREKQRQRGPEIQAARFAEKTTKTGRIKRKHK